MKPLRTHVAGRTQRRRRAHCTRGTATPRPSRAARILPAAQGRCVALSPRCAARGPSYALSETETARERSRGAPSPASQPRLFGVRAVGGPPRALAQDCTNICMSSNQAAAPQSRCAIDANLHSSFHGLRTPAHPKHERPPRPGCARQPLHSERPPDESQSLQRPRTPLRKLRARTRGRS